MKNKNSIYKGFVVSAILILSISIAEAKILKYDCTGDNKKCYRPTISGNTFKTDLDVWYFHARLTLNDSNQVITVQLRNVETRYVPRNYWTVTQSPTIKYSCDYWNWYEVKPTKDYGNYNRDYTFKPGCKLPAISTFIAFPYFGVMDNLKKWEANEYFNVTYEPSTFGLKFPVVEITNKSISTPKKCVVMTFRQHSGEIYSSWYMYEILKEFNLNHYNINDYDFLIFPMANPDGVYYGEFQFNHLKQDLNDNWDKEGVYEVDLMKKYISQFNQSCGKIDYYFDWHGGNLGFYDDSFMYYTANEKPFADIVASKTKFTSGKFTGGEWMSANYMRSTYGAITFTPEIQCHQSWNTVNNMRSQARIIMAEFFKWTK